MTKPGISELSVEAMAERSDNYIHFVEAYKPPKNLTLAYLEDPYVSLPKYAHVSAVFSP
jgi:hypothetical protein